MDDVRTTCGVEDARIVEEPGERLAIMAVAHEAQAGGFRDAGYATAQVAASASKRELEAGSGRWIGVAHSFTLSVGALPVCSPVTAPGWEPPESACSDRPG